MSPVLNVVEPAARLVAAAAFNSLWEDALLVLAVWAVLRVLPRLNAATRYAAWIVTLIAAIVLPVATSWSDVTVVKPALTNVATATWVAPPKVSVRTTRPERKQEAASVPAAPAEAPLLRTPERLHFAVPAFVAIVLFAVWLLAVLVIAARLVVDVLRLEGLKRDSLPLSLELRDALERLMGMPEGLRDVRLCVSDRIEVPVAVGLFDSMILLPQHLLNEFSAGEIDRISLHELGHIRRNDDWTNMLQRIAQTLLFFNPAIRFIGAQLDVEREVACDDWVLQVTGEVRPYASCLTKMAELTAWPHRPLAAPGVFVTRKGISLRIERLLAKNRNAQVKIAYGIPLALGASLMAFFVLVNFVTPVIAYTEESQGANHGAPAATHVAEKPHAPAKAFAAKNAVTATAMQSGTRLTYIPPAAPPKTAAKPEAAAPAAAKTVVKAPAPRVVAYANAKAASAAAAESGGGAGAGAGADSSDADSLSVPPMNLHVPAITVKIPRIDIPAVPGMKVVADGGFNCSGCDFHGANLSGKDLSKRSFVGANFAHANLQSANFHGSNLSGVDFHGADLRNADFTDANLTGCEMHGADITGARFQGANISGCDGVSARSMSQDQLRVWLTNCHGCDFAGADFHGMDLRNVNLMGADLKGANFEGADLSGTQFSGTDLEGARFSGAKLHGTKFIGCDFRHTDLRNVDLSDVQLTGSDLSEAIMR